LKIVRSNLKAILDERGFSIRQLAREIDYRFDSVRQMYNDEIERYPRDLLTKLCEYLDVTPSEILKYVDIEEAPK
jgi:DNA-binding Xre family transcriptional regulator